MKTILYKRHPLFLHLFCGSNGEIFSTKGSVFLKQQPTKKKYLQISIGRKSYRSHRLIAQAFMGLSDLQVDHINGIKTDNNISNLEYVSNRENFDRSISNGLRAWDKVKGELNSRSKLKASDVIEARALVKNIGSGLLKIAKRCGVSINTLKSARKRKTWKHL